MSDETTPSEEYFEGLLKHRGALLDLKNDQIKNLDKAILTVSSGALGLSIAFVDKFSGPGQAFGLLLFLSWVSFGASIVLNIVSYFTSFKDAEREIRKIDDCIRSVTEWRHGGNKFQLATHTLNVFALALFCCGVILLACHAYSGIPES